jgi:hypothetical protein
MTSGKCQFNNDNLKMKIFSATLIRNNIFYANVEIRKTTCNIEFLQIQVRRIRIVNVTSTFYCTHRGLRW